MKVLAMPPPTISWSTLSASEARIESFVDASEQTPSRLRLALPPIRRHISCFCWLDFAKNWMMLNAPT